MAEYKNIRQNGIIAINLKENDELINVQITNGKKDLILGYQTVKQSDLRKFKFEQRVEYQWSKRNECCCTRICCRGCIAENENKKFLLYRKVMEKEQRFLNIEIKIGEEKELKLCK